MNKRKNKTLNRKIVSSSVSVIISLSLVLFVLGLLSLFLINAQRLTNYVKENVGFSIMINDNIKEIELIEFNKILDAEDFTKSTKFISKEQLIASKYAKEAIKKYKIDSNKPMPTKL